MKILHFWLTLLQTFANNYLGISPAEKGGQWDLIRLEKRTEHDRKVPKMGRSSLPPSSIGITIPWY